MNKFEWLRQRLDFANISALELRIVKRVQVIERPNAVAALKQPFTNVRADESGATGYKEIHGRTVTKTHEGWKMEVRSTDVEAVRITDSISRPQFMPCADRHRRAIVDSWRKRKSRVQRNETVSQSIPRQSRDGMNIQLLHQARAMRFHRAD